MLFCILEAVEGGLCLLGGVGGAGSAGGDVLCATLCTGGSLSKPPNFHCGSFLGTVRQPCPIFQHADGVHSLANTFSGQCEFYRETTFPSFHTSCKYVRQSSSVALLTPCLCS